MDPRNYGMYGQSSPRNNSLNGQSFQGLTGLTGCTGCGFQQGACQGFSGCTGCGVQQGACQGFQQGCQGFQGCTGCGVRQGACSGTACSGQGCGQGMPCVSDQGQNLSYSIFVVSGVGGLPIHFSERAKTSNVLSPLVHTCIGLYPFGNIPSLWPNNSGTPLTWFTCSPNACLNLSTCIGSKPCVIRRISCIRSFCGVTPPTFGP